MDQAPYQRFAKDFNETVGSKDAGEIAKLTGISKGTIESFRTGKGAPSIEELTKLATGLELGPPALKRWAKLLGDDAAAGLKVTNQKPAAKPRERMPSASPITPRNHW